MNLLLLGKTGGITHWTEDVASDLRLSGHAVTIVPTRNPWLSKSLERGLLSPAIGAPLAAHVVRRMRRLQPALILAVGALDQFPPALFQPLSAARDRPPLVAWIGDAFTAHHRVIADLFDLVAYTDTGMLALHHQYGFRAQAAFVPLGATRVPGTRAVAQRTGALVFVAAPTDNRRAVLAAMRDPVTIFGPGWQGDTALAHHRIDARRIMAEELTRLYATHMGVLNIRHGVYVINGLNQRHFAPYIQGTPVITDAQPDIPHSFDPGTEMLVYQDVDELNALYAGLRADPARAAAIGAAGRRRVLAQHTYAHRLDTLGALAGVNTYQTHP